MGFLQSAQAVSIDFEADAAGAVANGFQSVDSAQVTFTDTVGTDLQIGAFPEGDGQSLAVFDDLDGSGLRMDLSFVANAIQLDFGNDDPFYVNPGDLAVLNVYLLNVFVGQTTIVLTPDDLMNQTISFAGLPFDRADFFYTDAAQLPFTGGGAVNTGLIEIVDNILITPVPEPTAVLLAGMGIVGLVVGRTYRRRRAR
ncbi:MAG: PEP-CTERM sorting domain-containing protein [Pirellulales bacterium]